MQFCRRKRERIKIKTEGEVMIVDDFVVAAWLFTISQKVSQTPLRYTNYYERKKEEERAVYVKLLEVKLRTRFAVEVSSVGEAVRPLFPNNPAWITATTSAALCGVNERFSPIERK